MLLYGHPPPVGLRKGSLITPTEAIAEYLNGGRVRGHSSWNGGLPMKTAADGIETTNVFPACAGRNNIWQATEWTSLLILYYFYY